MTIFTKIFVVLIAGMLLIWGGFQFLNPNSGSPILLGFSYLMIVCAMILACIGICSRKIIVTSDAVISKSFYEEQVIPFKSIQRMQIGRRGKHAVLNIFTDQSTIALNYGGARKELIALKAYISRQIRENDPEHFNQVILPQNEPDSFMAFIKNK